MMARTIGEQRHLVGLVPELQDEIIVADFAMRAQPPVHLCEIDWPLPLMNLDGIPSAQRDVRPPLARKMNEVTLSASAAPGARFGGRNLRLLVRP